MADIVKVFEEFAGIKSVNMLTSGFFPKKIEKTVQKIINETSLALYFQISIDGIKQKHDLIRKNSESFDNAMQTIETLQRLRGQHSNRIDRISTLTTLGKPNYN